MAKLLRQVSSSKCFGGYQKVFEHDSEVLQCKMNFAVYIPKAAEDGRVPVLYFLSGLTCTEQNFITKSGVQQYAGRNNIMIVAPDTSPRGCNIEGEDDSWDFGTGAGFYVDATEEKWKKNYQMYSYCTKELPELIHANFPTYEDKQSIFGHSMGGHGALLCALRNPGKFRSVSCFAPICNPSACPWGQKALTGYLGSSKESWKDYDATHLIKSYSGPPIEILIDQGEQDQFYLDGQLLPENLVTACDSNKTELKLRMHKGYDHSYYFISTFVEDHIKFHARFLNA